MMWVRAARARTITCIVASAALLAAGCGGGDDAAVAPPTDPAAGAPPASTTAPDGTTVAGAPTDPNAAPAIDPATGQPIPAAPAAPPAEVPELVGDDTSSSSFGVMGGSEVFDPRAHDGSDEEESDTPVTPPVVKTPPVGGGTTAPGVDPPKPKPAPVIYAGAKMYVDGMIHAVQKNGTFPKGNPVFRLISVSAASVEIELVAGEFTAGGSIGTILDKGQIVSLVNASEQVTYKVKYITPIEAGAGDGNSGVIPG